MQESILFKALSYLEQKMIGKYCTPLMSTLWNFFSKRVALLIIHSKFMQNSIPHSWNNFVSPFFQKFSSLVFLTTLNPNTYGKQTSAKYVWKLPSQTLLNTGPIAGGGGIPLVLHGLSTSKAKILVLLIFLIEGPTALQPLSPLSSSLFFLMICDPKVMAEKRG